MQPRQVCTVLASLTVVRYATVQSAVTRYGDPPVADSWRAEFLREQD